MHKFEWNLPTKIVYGLGELSRLGELSKEFGKKVFLVTYRPSQKRTWILDKAVSSLKNEGIEVSIYDRIEANPRVDTVDEGVTQFHESGAEFFVALGGGSAIDATKYISSTAFSGGSSWDYVFLGNREAAIRELAIVSRGYPALAATLAGMLGLKPNRNVPHGLQ